MKEINNRIKSCRKSKGLTQTQMAEMLGLKCSTYSQMERKGEITCERLIKLSEIFKVDASVLLYGAGNIPEYGEKPKPEPDPEPPKPEPQWSKYAIPDLNKKERDHIICLRNLNFKKRNFIIELAFKVLKKEINLPI